jgi:glycosyltransferase involved in cell wall biosynthesis
MVLLEAKSHGLPIVSYACPTGPREIVREGVDGFLIEDDAAAFGAAVQKLIENGALREQMGEAARQDVDLRFGEKRACTLWRDLIEEIRQEAKTP